MDHLKQAKIIVCMGSGGVGKTTISTALAVCAADLGRRVFVLTIDPSQRLKTILKLDNTGAAKRIDYSIGKFFTASVLNHGTVFDDFVSRAIGRDRVAVEALLKNKLYKLLASDLSGSQEFTALEKLYELYSGSEYDLIILDTPPAQHANDFLSAPRRLSMLFSSSIVKWFKEPEGSFLQRVLQTGTVKALSLVETLTGRQFFQELRMFFSSIYSWSGKIEERMSQIQRMLVEDHTHFFLVSGHDLQRLEESLREIKILQSGGHRFSAMIFNRSYPVWMDTDESSIESEWRPLFNQLKGFYRERWDAILNWKRNISINVPIYSVPQMVKDVENIEDVVNLSKALEENK